MRTYVVQNLSLGDFQSEKSPLWHSVLSFTCILLSASIANSWIEFFLCVVVVGIRQKWQMICNHIWVKYPLKTKLQYVFICLGPPTLNKCIRNSKKTIIVYINTLSLFAAANNKIELKLNLRTVMVFSTIFLRKISEFERNFVAEKSL